MNETMLPAPDHRKRSDPVRLYFRGAGLLLVLAAAISALHKSGPGCGLILGRYSIRYFGLLMVLLISGSLLISAAQRLELSTLKKVIQSGILVLFGLGVGLILTEVGGYLITSIDPIESARPPSIEDARWENHDTFGHWLKPDNTFIYDGNQFTTDSNGIVIRTEEGNLPAPGGTRRIMMIGDSFLNGLEVPAHLNMSVLIEENLNQAPLQGTYDVLNLGKGGFSPIKYLLVYRHFAVEYQPDVVITLVFYTNDVMDDANIFADDRIIYDEKGDISRLIPEIDLEARSIWTPWGGLISFEVSEDIPQDRFSFERSITVNLAREYIILPLCAAAESQTEREALTVDPVPFHIPELPIRENQYSIFKENLTPQDLEDIERTLDYLGQLNQEIIESGAIMILVPVPDQIQVSETQPRTTTVIDSPSPQNFFFEFAEENGIPYVDLLPVLKAHGDEVLYLDDGHFNERGHQLVADTIYDVLYTLESE